MWQTLFDSGVKATRAKQYVEAEKQLNAALKNAETYGDKDKRLVATLQHLAQLHDEKGEYDKAKALYERALKCNQAIYGQESKHVAATISNLALVYKHQGNYAEATSLYLKAIAILEKSFPDSQLLAANYHNLAVVFEDQGKWSDAESLLKKAVAAFDKSLGEDHPQTKSVLASLGTFYSEQGRFLEAEPLLRRAAELPEGRAGALEPIERERLLKLAYVLDREGKTEESDALFEKALAGLNKDKDPDPADAVVFKEAGKFLARRARFEEAIGLLEKALHSQERALGRKSPDVADTLVELASIYAETANYEQAEALLKRTLEVCGTTYGAAHRYNATELSELGRLYMLQGKYSESYAAYACALKVLESTAGKEHPDVAACLSSMAMVLAEDKRYAQALPLVQRALSIRESSLSRQHPLVACSLFNLATVAIGQNDFEAAEKALKRAIEIDEGSLGPNHDTTLNAMRELASLYLRMRRFADAEETSRELVGRDETIEKQNPQGLASDLLALSDILSARNKPDEASRMRERADKLKRGVVPASAAQSARSLDKTMSLGAEHVTRPIKDKWAVVIGISNFKDSQLNLRYAAKDAVDFKNYLTNNANFKPDHVKLLLNSEATRENIVATLGDRWLRRLANSDDLVVIYISSHGSAPKEAADNTNFIVPYEGNLDNIVFTGIPMQWLTAGLKELIHCDRVAIVLDVCHGGAVGQESRGMKRTGGFSVNAVAPGKGQLILASSDSDQQSWESRRYPNGIFTKKLIESLQARGDQTPLTEAFQKLKEGVEEEVLRDRAQLQTPVLITSGWTGRDLVLSTRPVAPRPGLEAGVQNVTAQTNTGTKSGAGTIGRKELSVKQKKRGP
ncbi:MAG TPA: tetratricopeptide repeat protein [Candidatus Obscuribacterales bacterium]